MANLYYDFLNQTAFTPYVNVGLGYSHLKAEHSFSTIFGGSSFNGSSNNFVWSAGVGIAYKITDNLTLDTSYRYIDFGKVNVNNSFKSINPLTGKPFTYNYSIKTKTKVTANEFNLGVRYTF